MPIITSIKDSKNKKLKIFIDDEFAFCLYKTEVKKLKLKENMEIDVQVIDYINSEIIYKRARERALYIIERNEKTEYQLREKLKANDYTKEIIDKVVDMLKGYGYLDDLSYARRYFSIKCKTKSHRAIEQELYLKHVSGYIVKKVISENELSELEAIKNLVTKKYSRVNLENEDDRNKLIIKLRQRGFRYDDINSVLREISYK